MDQLGITFVVLVPAIAMMFVWALRQNSTGGIRAMRVARQNTSFLADGFRMPSRWPSTASSGKSNRRWVRIAGLSESHAMPC